MIPTTNPVVLLPLSAAGSTADESNNDEYGDTGQIDMTSADAVLVRPGSSPTVNANGRECLGRATDAHTE
jgi:hypothetical protein